MTRTLPGRGQCPVKVWRLLHCQSVPWVCRGPHVGSRYVPRLYGSALSGGHGQQVSYPALRLVGGGPHFIKVNARPHAVATNCAASLAALQSPVHVGLRLVSNCKFQRLVCGRRGSVSWRRSSASCTRRHLSASGRPRASLIERGAMSKSAVLDGRAAARASRRAAALVAASLSAARGAGHTFQRGEETLVPRRGGGEDEPLPLLTELLDHVAKTGPPMVPRECPRSGG
jgi:hypothetical protein